VVLVLIGIGFACQPSGNENTLAARQHLARVSSKSGTVDVLRAGAVDWMRIEAGHSLYEDDRVRTFKGAWAQLTFDGGSTLRVDEESLIAIGGGITVERGSVAGELQAGLKLKTPAAELESVAARDIVFR
jgi:hypothetical protein